MKTHKNQTVLVGVFLLGTASFARVAADRAVQGLAKQPLTGEPGVGTKK